MHPGTIVFIALAASANCASAQETYKCADKAARVTYSDVACEKLGLRLTALVGERISIIGMPGRQAQVRAAPAPMPPAEAVRPKS